MGTWQISEGAVKSKLEFHWKWRFWSICWLGRGVITKLETDPDIIENYPIIQCCDWFDLISSWECCCWWQYRASADRLSLCAYNIVDISIFHRLLLPTVMDVSFLCQFLVQHSTIAFSKSEIRKKIKLFRIFESREFLNFIDLNQL